MNNKERLEKLKQFQITEKNESVLFSHKNLLSWIDNVSPLLKYDTQHYNNFVKSARTASTRGLSSKTITNYLDIAKSTVNQAIIELENDITEAEPVMQWSATIQKPTHTQSQNTSSLHPWGVISSSIFELSSDEVVEIVSITGLQIDWSLSTKESYSHTTRKRAYVPRVNSAFSKLSGEDKLRVVQVVATEFIQRHPDLESTLRDRLNTIGWTIDSGAIVPSSREVAELFFPRGSEHDAYVELKKIIQSAQRSIIIVDPYLDSSILTLLGTCNNSLEIRLISYKLPNDFTLEVANFRKQHSSHTLEIRLTREFHDRFIVIDDVNCFHIGASIKDAGDRAFMINQVQDKANVCAIIEQVGKSWDGAMSEQN